MAEYDGISQFHKVALQRLRDAEELLQPPTLLPHERGALSRHLRGAMYLAGYALECVLKEYLISHTNPPVQRLSRAVETRRNAGEEIPDLQSALGHNLQLLVLLTDLEATLTADRQREKNWRLCQQWKSTWRYDSSTPTRAEAEAFVEATRLLYSWIANRVA